MADYDLMSEAQIPLSKLEPEEDQNLRQWFEVKRRLTHGPLLLDRATCDWVIDEEADTAICRTHGEVVDGVDSKHFPGKEASERDKANDKGNAVGGGGCYSSRS